MASTRGDSKATTSHEYKYCTIKEAYEEMVKHGADAPNSKKTYVNLYAVVIECSNVRPTKGTDMICNLRLADVTAIEMGISQGVELLCFAQEEHKLPRPEIGDIIRMHRVSVGEWSGNLQFMGKVAERTPFQFLLFSGSKDQGSKPYKSSSITYNFSKADENLLAKLRGESETILGNLASNMNATTSAPATSNKTAAAAAAAAGPASASKTQNANANAASSSSTSYLKRIDRLNENRKKMSNETFDLLCKVLYVGAEHQRQDDDEEESGMGMIIRVWDGTDVMPCTIETDETAFFEEIYPDYRGISHRLELSTGELIGIDPQSLEAKVGTALGVKVPPVMRKAVEDISRNSWIMFRNLRSMIIQGQIQGLYTEKSRWGAYQENQGILSRAKAKLQSNVVSSWAPQGAENLKLLKTRTKHSTKPFTTLRQIRREAGLGKPNKYRVLAMMTGYAPTDFADFCKKVKKRNRGGEGGSSESSQADQYVFSIKIRLEDSTGELDAILYGEDAEKFFGVKACDLRHERNAGVAEEIGQRCHSYMGFGAETAEGHQQEEDKIEWLDLCLFSYFTDAKKPWESCHFRVFDSRARA